MKYFFDSFTEEEIEKFEDYDFEQSDNGLHHLDCDFTVYKLNDKYYVERDESESSIQEMGGNYYVLDPIWYMHFDLDRFVQDYVDEKIDSESFYLDDYGL